MSHHHETKKEKKKKIMERNKRNQKIFWALSIMRGAAEGLAAPEIEARQETDEDLRKKKEENITWSAKTQDIRNRLNSKKRQAEDRWNRFAGTESAGAMGR